MGAKRVGKILQTLLQSQGRQDPKPRMGAHAKLPQQIVGTLQRRSQAIHSQVLDQAMRVAGPGPSFTSAHVAVGQVSFKPHCGLSKFRWG